VDHRNVPGAGSGEPFEGPDSYGGSRVVAVILARNEEPTIHDAVIGAAPFVHEVVVVDGRSSDGTVAQAQRAGARVLSDPGQGKGSGIRMAIQAIEADVLVFMDADGSHDPADIPRLALPVTRGEADLCIGSRFSGGSEELSVSFGQLIRTIGNISMNIAINRRWRVELSDTLNGFRAVRRSAAMRVGLRENRHTIEQEVVMKMLRAGFTAQNVPTHERRRLYGESHIDIWKEWPRFVWCVVRNVAFLGPVVVPLADADSPPGQVVAVQAATDGAIDAAPNGEA